MQWSYLLHKKADQSADSVHDNTIYRLASKTNRKIRATTKTELKPITYCSMLMSNVISNKKSKLVQNTVKSILARSTYECTYVKLCWILSLISPKINIPRYELLY